MKSIRERLEGRITKDVGVKGCWTWEGWWAVRISGVTYRPRRAIWELLKGAVPPGTSIIGLCGTDSCVRPDPGHCEPSLAKSNFKKKAAPPEKAHQLSESTKELIRQLRPNLKFTS
jgi:hypothetical protein